MLQELIDLSDSNLFILLELDKDMFSRFHPSLNHNHRHSFISNHNYNLRYNILGMMIMYKYTSSKFQQLILYNIH